MVARPRNRRVEIGPRTSQALLRGQEKFGESADQIVARALKLPRRTSPSEVRGTSSKRIRLSADVYEALEWQCKFGESADDTLRRILRDGPRPYPRRRVPSSRERRGRHNRRNVRTPRPTKPSPIAGPVTLKKAVAAGLVAEGEELHFRHPALGSGQRKAPVSGEHLLYEGTRHTLATLAKHFLADTDEQVTWRKAAEYWYALPYNRKDSLADACR